MGDRKFSETSPVSFPTIEILSNGAFEDVVRESGQSALSSQRTAQPTRLPTEKRGVALLEHFPSAACLLDAEGRLIDWNAAFGTLYAFPHSLLETAPSLAAMNRYEAARGESAAIFDEKAFDRAQSDPTVQTYEREQRDGRIVEITLKAIDDGLVLATHTDVTAERRRAQQLDALVSNYPGGICLYDKNLRMVLHNDALQSLLDYPDHLFEGDAPTMEDLFRFNAERGEYGDRDVEELVAERLERAALREAHDYERTRPNGAVLSIRGAPVAGGGFLTTYHDVTEKHKSQALISHMAHHDALTDLPNRTLLADRLAIALANAKRGACFALIYLDLDKFKPVNDAYGHAIGDELLRQAAQRLVKATRETDTVARVGGDEFVIVAAGVSDAEGSKILAARLNEEMAKPFAIGRLTLGVSASIGVALAPDHGVEADRLMSSADAALYASKEAGRNTYRLFRPMS